MNFHTKLEAAWKFNDSLLCVGLDPHPSSLPKGFEDSPEAVAEFAIAVIEETRDLVCAYKPNFAFFERMGPENGFRALRQILKAIPSEIVTVADAKRGDVDFTAQAYVEAIFDNLGFDCATVNTYLGLDTLEPWIARREKGAFVCCRTSNRGAGDLQDLIVNVPNSNRRVRLFEYLAEAARNADKHQNVGLVAGAPYPQDIARLREICPDMPFLVPGVGAQGGSPGEAVRAGLDSNGRGLLVSASRSVASASLGSDFASAARREAIRLRDEINVVRAKPPVLSAP